MQAERPAARRFPRQSRGATGIRRHHPSAGCPARMLPIPVRSSCARRRPVSAIRLMKAATRRGRRIAACDRSLPEFEVEPGDGPASARRASRGRARGRPSRTGCRRAGNFAVARLDARQVVLDRHRVAHGREEVARPQPQHAAALDDIVGRPFLRSEDEIQRLRRVFQRGRHGQRMRHQPPAERRTDIEPLEFRRHPPHVGQRRQQHDARDRFGMIDRHRQRNRAAERMTDQQRLFQPQFAMKPTIVSACSGSRPARVRRVE